MQKSYLNELLETAADISHLDSIEDQLSDRADWKVAKEQYDAQVARFNQLRTEYVDALLQSEGASSAATEVQEQLSEFRQQADPSWHPAVDYTEQNLLPYLKKEAAKSPGFRKALKIAPVAIGALVVIAYFGVRLFSATPITAGIETREGLLQRAAAVEKVIRYDDWMGTRVRRGGLFKGLILWPIKPTDPEIEGAAEFVGLVLEGQKYADGCGAVVGFGEDLTDDQIQLVSHVSNHIQNPNIDWQNPPPMTILKGLETAKAC